MSAPAAHSHEAHCVHKPPAPRKEHRLPTDVVPRHYDVELRPDLQAATFAATLAVRVDITSPTRTVELNAVELQVQTANIVCGVSRGRRKGARLQRLPERRVRHHCRADAAARSGAGAGSALMAA
jgi:hypothetical protein